MAVMFISRGRVLQLPQTVPEMASALGGHESLHGETMHTDTGTREITTTRVDDNCAWMS